MCAWLIEFIFMINVFFFPSHFCLVLLRKTSSRFYWNSFRLLAPLLLVIYLLFVLPFFRFVFLLRALISFCIPSPTEKMKIKSSRRILLLLWFILREGKRERETKTIVSMVLCSICACRGLSSMLLLVIHRTNVSKRRKSPATKRFNSLTLLLGRLCVYRRIWWTLFSFFLPSVIIIIHYLLFPSDQRLVNLFMIWPALLSEEFWKEFRLFFFCFIKFFRNSSFSLIWAHIKFKKQSISCRADSKEFLVFVQLLPTSLLLRVFVLSHTTDVSSFYLAAEAAFFHLIPRDWQNTCYCIRKRFLHQKAFISVDGDTRGNDKKCL